MVIISTQIGSLARDGGGVFALLGASCLPGFGGRGGCASGAGAFSLGVASAASASAALLGGH